MRLAEPATVSKFECLKTLCAGVMADLVIRFFHPNPFHSIPFHSIPFHSNSTQPPSTRSPARAQHARPTTTPSTLASAPLVPPAPTRKSPLQTPPPQMIAHSNRSNAPRGSSQWTVLVHHARPTPSVSAWLSARAAHPAPIPRFPMLVPLRRVTANSPHPSNALRESSPPTVLA